MNSKDIVSRFKELSKKEKFECTEQELNEFLLNGLIFKEKNKYVTRYKQNININVLNSKTHNLNINLSNLISICEEKSKELKNNKIYCMTQTCYNKYIEQGLIVKLNGIEYFRIFDKELWIVYKF